MVKPPQLVLFIGIQASGKSTFYRERFFRTHVRINLDMLKTRHREQLLFAACIAGKTPCVVDNTNLTRGDRARYLEPARAAGFVIHGYFFNSTTTGATARNAARQGTERVPDAAIRSAAARLELPSLDEGFDALYQVRITAPGAFEVNPDTVE